MIAILIDRTKIKIIKLFIKLSDIVVDVDVDDLSITIDVKTPIFNIALAASNSNAKSNPEIKKFLLILFEFEIDDDCRCCNSWKDLRLCFKKMYIIWITDIAIIETAIISITEVIIKIIFSIFIDDKEKRSSDKTKKIS